jgi:DNA-binding beta-propeller fold protein YncE
MTMVPVPDCAMGEDVILSEDNSTWYLTCMMSANVIVGDVATDRVTGKISLPDTYPHGLAVHSGIDRILVTSTIKGDLTDPRETISVVEAGSHKMLGSHKLSLKESPSGEAPVEILLHHQHVRRHPLDRDLERGGGRLRGGTGLRLRHRGRGRSAGDVLQRCGRPALRDHGQARQAAHLRHRRRAARAEAKHLKTLPAGEGAHHVAITKDGKLAFVQNALLNLPGMSEGTITVIDLEKQEVVANVETLKNLGLNPNSIVLLPEWNSLAGH